MNVIAALGASPFAASRRATGTEPHSQTGNATPAAAAAGSCRLRGSDAMRANADAGTSTSIAADTVAPSRMNGIASTSRDPNTISRFRSQGRLEGSTTRANTATATSTAVTI